MIFFFFSQDGDISFDSLPKLLTVYICCFALVLCEMYNSLWNYDKIVADIDL